MKKKLLLQQVALFLPDYYFSTNIFSNFTKDRSGLSFLVNVKKLGQNKR